ERARVRQVTAAFVRPPADVLCVLRRAGGCALSRGERAVRPRAGRRARPAHLPGLPGRPRAGRLAVARAHMARRRRRPPGTREVGSSIDTAKGPSDWFTGDVYIDTVAVPSGPSHVSASAVHFTPGARTAWHTHPNGQTIYVLEGVGLCQRRGGP